MENKLFGIDVSKSVDVQDDIKTETILKNKRRGKIPPEIVKDEQVESYDIELGEEDIKENVVSDLPQNSDRETDIIDIKSNDTEYFDKTR